MKTISDYWDSAAERPAGFDCLRTALALSIILIHTVLVCYGQEIESAYWLGAMRPVFSFPVPAFFALSGFLVAGSLLRNDISSFIVLRGLRIYPALMVEVIISSLIVGLIFTAYDPGRYFSDPEFFRYLLNAIGWVHYTLPGVFHETPAGPTVNLQMWTIPIELQCYVALTCVGAVSLHRHRVLFGSGVVLVTIAAFIYTVASGVPLIQGIPPKVVFLSFLFGIAFYLFRDRIVVSKIAVIASTIIAAGLVFSETYHVFSPIFISYITVCFGVQNMRIPIFNHLSNYSYGMYLYGFPIQQAVSAAFPDFRHWWFNALVSIPLTLLAAALSWILVEKPVLTHRRAVLAFVTRLRSGIARRTRQVAGGGGAPADTRDQGAPAD